MTRAEVRPPLQSPPRPTRQKAIESGLLGAKDDEEHGSHHEKGGGTKDDEAEGAPGTRIVVVRAHGAMSEADV